MGILVNEHIQRIRWELFEKRQDLQDCEDTNSEANEPAL